MLQPRAVVRDDFPFPHQFTVILASGIGGGGLDESAEDLYTLLSISTNLNKLVVPAFFIIDILSSHLRLIYGFGGLIHPGADAGL